MTRRVPLRQSLLVLTLIGIPYFVATIVISARRHLWNDELFTYYFANLPSLHDVWHQLETGVEQTPPLFYVVTRASLAAFGHNTVAIRAPAILGVFAACCCVYLVVARRTSVVVGSIAALGVLATTALPYGYEARPYGLVLGFAAMALLCWQLRIDTGSRFAAVGVAAALACAVSTHYYATLLVVPIAAGETARSVQRRRIDPLVPLALLAGLAPLVAYKPLIDGARRYSGSFWTTFDWGSSLTFFAWLDRTPALPPAVPTAFIVGLTCALVAGSLVITTIGSGPAVAGIGRRRGAPARGDLPERVAAVAFLLLPLLAVALAKSVTGAYTERYTLFAVIGLAVLVSLALDRVATRWRVLPWLVVACLSVFLVRACVYDYRDVSGDLARQRETIRFLDRSNSALPLVVAHPHDFLELSHYAPPRLHRRLLYLASLPLAQRYLGSDSTEAGVIVLSRFAPLNVRAYRSFVESKRPFLVFFNPGAGPREWLLRALAADGRTRRVVARDNGRLLYLVGR